MGWLNLSLKIPNNIAYSLMNKYKTIEECMELNRNIDDKLYYFLNKSKNENDEKLYEKCLKKGINIYSFKDEGYKMLIKDSKIQIPYIFTKGKIEIASTRLTISSNNKLESKSKLMCKDILLNLDKDILLVINSITESDKFLRKLLSRRNIIRVVLDSLEDRKYYDNELLVSMYPFVRKLEINELLKNNLLMASLVENLYIPESKKYSRAMILAQIMSELDKEIYVTAGYGENFEGCNYLIKKYVANLVTNSDDINKGVKNG